MGQLLTHHCPQCGYSAFVSGGADGGKGCQTQTILCYDCGELRDIETASLWAPKPEANDGRQPYDATPFGPVRQRCPKSRKHRWRVWNFPDVCPQCGQPMARNPIDEVMMWD